MFTKAFYLLFIVLRYFLVAGFAYFLFYVWKRKSFLSLKIIPDFPTNKRIFTEVFFSLCTLAIYCIVVLKMIDWSEQGLTQVYGTIHEHSITYFVLSIFLLILIHDAYFYWTHRLIHLKGLFSIIHRTHHLSTNPTPWASFAFHPIEAIISIAFMPIIIFILPLHPFAIFIFLTIMIIVNVMGHLGYELFSWRFRNQGFTKWHNSSTAHFLHHQLSTCNYGLYFTFWDRVMGTYMGENPLPPLN